ncbi:MAG: hypothetical protein MJZ12_00350 [Prevotella sp.]|nr:hypothetical protein [Prevotella sp.]
MKRLLAILILCLSLTSCKALMYGSWASGAAFVHPIKDYALQMDILKNHFPEVYDLYKAGKVTCPDVYQYRDKYGSDKYHISYYDRY